MIKLINKKTEVTIEKRGEIDIILSRFTMLNNNISVFDVNSLLRINIIADENRDYLANISRALVKTIRNYCSESFFRPEGEEGFLEHTIDLRVLGKDIKERSLYALLFNFIIEDLGLITNSFTNEIELFSGGQFRIITKKSNTEKNLILVSYCYKTKKIYFLEKSGGNINKQYLLDYLSKLSKND